MVRSTHGRWGGGGGTHSPSHLDIKPRCLSYEYGGKYAKYAVLPLGRRPWWSSSPSFPESSMDNSCTCVHDNLPSSYDVSLVLSHACISNGVDLQVTNVEYPA
jgi:hypothetical protein